MVLVSKTKFTLRLSDNERRGAASIANRMHEDNGFKKIDLATLLHENPIT